MLDSPDDMKLSEIESLVNFCSRFGHHSTLEPLMQACHGGGVHSGGRRSRRHDGGDKHLKDGLMGRVKNPHVNGTARDFNCPQMDGITEQVGYFIDFTVLFSANWLAVGSVLNKDIRWCRYKTSIATNCLLLDFLEARRM